LGGWIPTPPTPRALARFGVAKYGEPLFFGDARR
jgi:hypothetical protein